MPPMVTDLKTLSNPLVCLRN